MILVKLDVQQDWAKIELLESRLFNIDIGTQMCYYSVLSWEIVFNEMKYWSCP